MNPPQCPKCAYTRVPTDSAPSYECPSCGVVYAKYKASAKVSLQGQPSKAASSQPSVSQDGIRRQKQSSAQIRIVYVALIALALTILGALIDPRIPIVVAFVALAIWIVRKAMDGSREAERKRAAATEHLPYQHCLTCGHDFKHDKAALRGSTTMEIALWVLILWPIALVYSIWRRLGAGKARIACVICASTEVVPATSPAAVAHKRTLGA